LLAVTACDGIPNLDIPSGEIDSDRETSCGTTGERPWKI
jgi:hypothetical protein